MIFVKEEFISKNTLGIWVEGTLDLDSIPVLRDVCTHHLENHKSIKMYLSGLLHITREGKVFLQEIQKKVCIIDLPPYMRLSANPPN